MTMPIPRPLDPTQTGNEVAKLRADLERMVIGQPEAIDQIVMMYQSMIAGLNGAGRPLGNFLFLGPSGCGKTQSVESTATSLLGSPKSMLKVDCAEFQHSHEIAKLIGCFLPDTPVLMADGTCHPIDSVQIGDRVICGDGIVRPVLDTHKYNYDGPINKLWIASNSEPIGATPEHGIYSVKNPSNGKRNRKLDSLYDSSLLAKNEIQSLIKKDIVVWPRWKNGTRSPAIIDLADYTDQLTNPVIEVDWVSPRGKLVNKIRRFIEVDEDFCRIAGYYIAEGGVTTDQNNYSGVNFTMGVPSKQDAIDDLKIIFNKVFGIDVDVLEEDRSECGSIRLYMFSQILGKFFEGMFGRTPHTKRIPEWFLYLEDNLLWNFLDAACMGDGGRTEPRRFDYSTTSQDLHWQINTIFRSRLGVTTQVQTHLSKNPKWATRYRTYVAGAQIDWVCAKLPMFGKIIDLVGDMTRANQGIQRGSFVDDDYVYFQVEGNDIENYTGTVHDISVSEDPHLQWYVAGGVKVRNSPPGYLGHRETHPLLAQETLNQHHTDTLKLSIVLFDEIEKASNSLWNLLLGILDKATLTLGDNRRVDFSRAMIFMTSNLGATEMNRILSPGMGFTLPPVEDESTTKGRISKTGLESARKNFTPEFMNRLDSVVVFRNLSEGDIDRIMNLELAAVQQRILTSAIGVSNPFVFRLTPDARQLILSNSIDTRYGARHMKRTIDRMLVKPFSNLISSGQIRGGDIIEVDTDSDERLLFSTIEENVPMVKLLTEIGKHGTDPLGPPSGLQLTVPATTDRYEVLEPSRKVIPYARKRTR